MKKIIFIITFLSLSFSQTGIITADGFRGYGLWAKVNKSFSKEIEATYDFKFEFYSSIGIEVSASTSREESLEPWNSLGFGYHHKVRNLGLQIFYSKNLYDTFNFNQKENSFDIYSITLYRTSKLNPFFEISKRKGFGEDSADIEGNVNNSIDYLTVGGLGRITRFMTLSGSLKIPLVEVFNISNGTIEASIGFVY